MPLFLLYQNQRFWVFLKEKKELSKQFRSLTGTGLSQEVFF